MSEWKNDRAEMAMREAGKKIMEEAAKKSVVEFKEVGKWTVTMSGNENHTEKEINEFLNKLTAFSIENQSGYPNLKISIDPA